MLINKYYSILVVLLLSFFYSFSQTGIPVATMSNCDNMALDFLDDYDIPGMTMAIAKDGKLVYMRAFGTANLAGTEAVQPYHMFRIASISKPITSVGIMKLMEEGKINMDDRVFGTGGLLGDHPYFAGANVADERTFDITVQQLLEHAGGWDSQQDCTPNPTSPYPWYANHCDPIGFPLHVTETLGTSNPVAEQDLVKFLLEKTLGFAPGTSYAYSNIGYLTLGIIIEEITGMSYEEYMKQEIFEPIGICDMHLAKNLLQDKYEREGEYPPGGFESLSVYGTGELLPSEYGAWNIEAFDAHGGWIATASDLIRFLVAVDKFNTKPDILSPATIDVMITPSANNINYAKGWGVNQFDNWWHTGAIDGTASNFVRTSGGFTFAIILNKRVIGTQANNFWADFDNLPWDCITGVNSFPTHDLLLKPDVPSTDVAVSPIEDGTVSLSWTNGNGNRRIIVARENTPVDAYPLDGFNHSGNGYFSWGEDLGNNNYVVYDGTGNGAWISGLSENSKYYFRIFEYNQNPQTGDYPVYNLCGSLPSIPTGIFESNAVSGINVFPNPTGKFVNVSTVKDVRFDEMLIYDMMGKVCMSVRASDSEVQINIRHLQNGVYHLMLLQENKPIGGSTFIKQ